jgi:hypothetical protein
MVEYTQEMVDGWIQENNEQDASVLFQKLLPEYASKLDRLDKRIRDVLTEIRGVFPDAKYYTASGGFTLLLGSSHSSDISATPQHQRVAWNGFATIDGGDW